MPREKVKEIEVLSPGKNLFYAKEVIRCGADAVYVGAPKFSLRYGNKNSMEDIKKLVEFAHQYWVNIYVALNGLIYSQEDIDATKKMINEFYEIGVDGIIIQDLGILEFDLPPVPIILSVNAMCGSKEDAKFFEDCGVSRIVLPRQLSYDDIKDIAENTTVPLEAFCYGFICVGKDGNCYLSYVENLKNTKSEDNVCYLSSNHGLCPERCMRNWTLKDANGNIIRENDRLLNLKYLNLDAEFKNMVKLGIDSFKIAGREKDLKHAKNSTALFSELANETAKELGIKRSSSGRVILGFKPDWHKNFNKGFSDFYLHGRKKENYTKYTLVGEDVGTVSEFKDNSFMLESKTSLAIGDKLRYKKDSQPVKIIEIIDFKGGRYYIKPIEDDITGLKLYRYTNVEGFREVEESVNYRVISVKLNFSADKVYAEDEDNNKIVIEYQKGSNKLNNPQKDFYKLDLDCEFLVDEVVSDEDIYIDDIEQFKNKIFEALRLERAKNRPVERKSIVKNNVPYHKKEINYLRNVNNECAKAFFERHGVEKIEPGLETSTNIEGKQVLCSKYCLRYELDLCSKTNPSNMPPLPWTIEQIESGVEYKIEFDCKKCEMHFYVKNKEL